MTVEPRHADEDPQRFEAARQAVRALAAAFRTLRLYPLGHELASSALHDAGRAIDAYRQTYGVLVFTAAPHGVAFDFTARAYADDLVVDLSRAMRARAAPGLRFLEPLDTGDIGELLLALHLPVHEVERAGGIGDVLRSRGVQHLGIEHVGVAAPALGVGSLEPFVEAAKTGSRDRIAAYLEQTGGNHDIIRQSLREFDRRIAVWPRPAQASAWKVIGQTLASLRVGWQAAACAMVVQSIDEPWAASLTSHWPPLLAASLAAQTAADAHERGRRVAEALRSFHLPIQRVPLPQAPPLTAAEIRQSTDELQTWSPERLRKHATRLFDELSPTVQTRSVRGKVAAGAPADQRSTAEGRGTPGTSLEERQTLTRLLIACLRQVRHYGSEHPMAAASVQQLESAIREELRSRPSVRWEVAGDWLIVQGGALPDGDRNGEELRRHLIARGIARLAVSPSANLEGLRTLNRILGREPEELIAAGGAAEAVRSARVQGVEVDTPAVEAPLPPETDEYRDATATASEVFAAIERGDTSIDAGRVRKAVEPIAARSDPLPLWRQVIVRSHDELDPAHAVNVAFLTIHIAQALRLGQATQVDLGVAAFLHDIGMARLNWEERLIERTRTAGDRPLRHALEGGLVLRHVKGGSLAMLVAMEHHHVIWGSHRDLTPHSRLVALVDYVDAMTCGRVVGLRPATLGGLLTALLADELPAFDPIHVRALAVLAGRAAAAGVDMTTPV